MKGRIASSTPWPLPVKAGTTYHVCTCGLSQQQPYCDGSHQGSQFTPIAYQAHRDQIVFFCGCKQSDRLPLCDGSHSKLQHKDSR